MPEIRLMPHQSEAISKMRNGCILCAGVGTGKSMTALGYYYICVCNGVVWDDQQDKEQIGPMTDPKPLYIITTARKRDTGEWEKECDRFELRDESVQVVIDSWNNLHKYEDVVDAFFIFDEQRVGGSGAWSKSFIRISKANEWILLSATPGDTWMDYISVFVANGFYKNKSAFLRRHAIYNKFSTYPKVDKWVEVGRLEMLRRRITVTMTYEKKTVPHWSDVFVSFDKQLYKKVSQDRWDPWKDEPIENAAGACYLMRRVVNENDIRARELFWLVLAKHPRAIVFYNYDYELKLIKDTFTSMLSLDNILDGDRDFGIGEWNGHKHEPIPSTKNWIYLVQYAAGCEGWNCVETDTIIFYSQSYSYKQMTQAAGRIDRLNTPFTDLYYYVFTTDSQIDMAIARALRSKKDFNEKNFLPKW